MAIENRLGVFMRAPACQAAASPAPPSRVGGRDTFAERCDAIVATAFVVARRGRPFVALLDQSGGEHPFDRPVQRARPEPDATPRATNDLLHDRVAVPLPVGEGEQDLELGGRKRKECLRLRRWRQSAHSSTVVISAIDITSGPWKVQSLAYQ